MADGTLPDDSALDTVDALARSAHLWVRRLCLSEALPADEQRALTGGLVAGLTGLMTLDARIGELAAYAVALRSHEDADAVSVARQMLARPDGPRLWAAYQRGKDEARRIVQLLGVRPMRSAGL